ncbi:universal stress protein [Rubrimonas sp.]|uniref:universal stress protein n=1 Tax=Rubrimonas sp. TaxID=2036015 RepID=UPI002FDEF6C6
MGKVLACVDGSVYADSVIDHAAWAATRLEAPVELLQVLGRREAASSDRSGRIVAGGRRKLLEQLAALDAERAKLAHEEAWLALGEGKARLEAAGVGSVTVALRHGDLLPTLDEREEDAELVIVGKRGEAADFATLHLGSNLERMVRSTRRPMLIAARAFKPISRFLVAFDGGPSALKAVDAISRSPLFAGLGALLLTAGEPTSATRAALEKAEAQLRAGGFDVEARVAPGRPETVIAETVEREEFGLLAMGAYGHSQLRALVIGSTTAALIRACRVPIAVYR